MRLLIVDDHEIMRKGLQAVFALEDEFEVVGEAATAEEAIKLVGSLSPDIVLMDIRMPGMDGSKATVAIKSQHPDVRVIALTAVDDDEDVFQTIENGVNGYLLKDTTPSELVQAVRAVAAGESYLHPHIARKVMERMSGQEPEEPPTLQILTSREMRVLYLMAHGYKNKEIAGKLFLSEETVKSHVSNILAKLNQADRVQAVLYAIRHGIIRIAKG